MGALRVMEELSDRELVGGLKVAVARSRKADVEVIRMIAEVDRRQLYREHACSSMFSFCVERLGMSDGAAYRRIRVARLSRELPVALEYLEEGRVHLVGLHLLAPHLNQNNAIEVLTRAVDKTQKQIERLVAELAPKPDVPARVRKVPAKCAAASEQLFVRTVETHQLPPRAVANRAKVQPLAPARYHVQFTASETLKKNLERARELAGHGASVESLVEDAMALLVAELEKDKLGVAGRKTGKVANPRGRYIAKAIRREVFERDQGQCTFVDGAGHRCSERKGLHFDHVVPHAVGGKSTAENLRLRCGPHNQLHAEQSLGPLFMANKRAASVRRE